MKVLLDENVGLERWREDRVIVSRDKATEKVHDLLEVWCRAPSPKPSILIVFEPPGR